VLCARIAVALAGLRLRDHGDLFPYSLDLLPTLMMEAEIIRKIAFGTLIVERARGLVIVLRLGSVLDRD